jgi:hypothetical protein
VSSETVARPTYTQESLSGLRMCTLTGISLKGSRFWEPELWHGSKRAEQQSPNRTDMEMGSLLLDKGSPVCMIGCSLRTPCNVAGWPKAVPSISMLVAIAALQTVPSDRKRERLKLKEVETSAEVGAREEEQVQAGHVNPRATLKHTLINWHTQSISHQHIYYQHTTLHEIACK